MNTPAARPLSLSLSLSLSPSLSLDLRSPRVASASLLGSKVECRTSAKECRSSVFPVVIPVQRKSIKKILGLRERPALYLAVTDVLQRSMLTLGLARIGRGTRD